MTGSSSFTGGTTIIAGTLLLSSANGVFTSHLGTNSVALANNSTLTLVNATSSALTLGNSLSVNAGAAATLSMGERSTLTGAVTGAGNSTLNVLLGSIDRDLLQGDWSGLLGTAVLNDTNSTVRGLQINASGGFTNGGLVNATLDVQEASVTVSVNTNGNTLQIGALTGSSAAVLGGARNAASNGSVTWQVGAKNLDTTYAGTVADGINPTTQGTKFIKVGTGTLTYTAASTHSGGTIVSGGTLMVNNPAGSATGTGSVTVDAESTLAGDGLITTGTGNVVAINGSLTIGSTGATQGTDLSVATGPGGSTNFGALSFARFDLWSTTGTNQSAVQAAADRLSIVGDLNIFSGSTLKLGNPYSLSFQDGDVCFAYSTGQLSALAPAAAGSLMPPI